MDLEVLAEQLEKTGMCVAPDFMPASLCQKLREDMVAIRAAGGFGRAGTGKGEGLAVRDQVRRDEIHWLERSVANPVQGRLWESLDSLKQAFNRGLFLGLRNFEGHYASYPAGGFYKRHLDCFEKDDARMVSLVLYLNQGWQAGDGGELRIYPGGGQAMDVQPREGTLVCFLSRDMEHEVLATRSPRFSFTGWFKSEHKPGSLLAR
ncbi:MAG: 2OG-Fe(II) oxygenase [Deltaproteobacteria bacterium]|nr:2OG-Fe(II) oxygenase [Deltaproteobacteria bacterium]